MEQSNKKNEALSRYFDIPQYNHNELNEEFKDKKHGLQTGCYDIFHEGHASAIRAASEIMKQKGGNLYVAVSTDETIKAYKGKQPIIPFQSRFAMVQIAAAGINDNIIVIPQEDVYDKVGLCTQYNIGTLFSSVEYQRDFYEDPTKMTQKEIAGVERWEQFEQDLGGMGVEVIYLPRTQGISSSIIKQNILDSCGAQQPQGIMLYSEGECCDESVFSL